MGIVLLAATAVVFMGAGCKPEPEEPGAAPATTPKEEVVKPVAAPGAFEAFKSKVSVPAVMVPLVSKAPAIDGQLDAAYKACQPMTFKFITGLEAKPTAPTTAYAVTTGKELFLFFDCQSPDMDALQANVTEHDGQVWNDDCIEMFIDPTNKRQIDGYMHIIINTLGTTAESKGPSGAEDYSWDPKLRLKAVKGAKGWTLEVAFPLADLLPDPGKINRVWAVNLNRMAYLIEGPEDTCWSPTETTSSHVPAKFGVFWLQAGNVDNTKD
ncbi:MAG: hypothetical protein AMJ81_12555 [Phycisphaerae bacterium SM23_33]|nr:MAG: hypothetical protein AMJ81_12555 [Phycisphaerae bacterium SM23_33]